MTDPKYKVVEASSLKQEDGARELASSPEMEPYMRYIEAALLQKDLKPSMEEIAELPLEKRYVWRVASALKWGFADFEDWSVVVDRKTLQAEDAAKLVELLRLRPIQFCMFMKALFGAEEMERMMKKGDRGRQRGWLSRFHALVLAPVRGDYWHMALTIEQALSIAAKSHGNAETLLQDAEVLFANERWPRVLFLCCIAQEELGKSILSIVAAVRIRLGEFDDGVERQYRRRFFAHRMKTDTLSAVLEFFFSGRPRGEIVQAVRGGDPSSKTTEIVKLGALYADFDGDGVRCPTDALPERASVEPTLQTTRQLLEMSRANILPLLEQVETCDIEVCRTWMKHLAGIL